MGGFLLNITNESHIKEYSANYNVLKGMNVFYQKGLKLNKKIQHQDFEIHSFFKLFHEPENTFIFPNEDFIIVVGTFFYNGKTGKNAVFKLYDDFKNNNDIFDKINGQYGIIAYINNKLQVFNDNLGLYQIYYDDKKKIGRAHV